MQMGNGRWAGVIGLSVAFVGAAAVVGPGDAGAAQSAQAYYQAALGNVMATTGVHYVSRASSGGVTQMIVGDAGTASGSQVLTVDFGKGKVGKAQVKLVNGTVYLNADSGFYAGTGIVSDPPPAGTWLVVTSSDQYYSQFASGLTVASVAQQIALSSPYSYRGAARIGRIRALGVKGESKEATSSGSVTVPETVWIRSTGTPVPVLVTAGNAKAKETVTLSKYGETVNVAVPAPTAPASQFGA